MNKVLTATLSVLLLLAPIMASAAAPSKAPGAPYVELPKAIEVENENKVEVREFFWYGCPHCYSIEPSVERWLKQKPANVSFVRTPAPVGAWKLHAQAYYAFEALGVLDQVHRPFFQALHQQNRRLNTEAAIAEFAKANGVDAAKFQEAFSSFGVRMKLEKARRLYEASGLDSVPAFVVAGKYVTSPNLAGEGDAMFKVLDQLIKQAGGASAKSAGAKK